MSMLDNVENAKVDYNEVTPTWHDVHKYSPAPRHRRRIICKIISKLNFNSCLDVGCAQPFLLLDISKSINSKNNRGGVELFGSDIAESVINENREKYKNIQFFQADISKEMHVDTQYDVVICSEVIEHIENYEDAIRNLCLLSGNYLLITVPTGKVFKIDKKVGHFRHYSLEQLKNELSKNKFEIVKQRKWGFPFHSLYKYLINYAMSDTATEKFQSSKYSFSQKFISNLLYILFFLNDLFSGGCQLFVLARKQGDL